MLLRTDSTNTDFQQLVRLLDAYLSELNGEEHTFYNQFNQIEALQYVVVAYRDGIPVGCGAIKSFNETSAEVKRMFVQPMLRGKGLAGQILEELEIWSRELGFTSTILETAIDMPSAIRLYTKSGYVQIPNYEPYVGMKRSVCMQKGRG